MAVSAETKAIIDTLKAEGQAMRDEGNPSSIASANLKLERLEKILNTVSVSIEAQTKAVIDETARQAEADEKARLQAELESLKNEKNAEKDKKEKVDIAKTIKNAIPNMLKGLQRTLTNFLLGGIGALALGGLVTGIADNLTGGGFSKFINDFIGGDWEKIRKTLDESGYNFGFGIDKLLKFAFRLAPGGDLHDTITGFTGALGSAIEWFDQNPLKGLAAASLLLSGTLRRMSFRIGKGALGMGLALGGGIYNSLRGRDPEMEKAKKATAQAEKKRLDAEKAEQDAKKKQADLARKDAEKAQKKGKKLTPDQMDALRGTGKYAPTPTVKPKGPSVMSDAPGAPVKPRNFDVLPDGSVISKTTGKPLTGAAKATALKFNDMDLAAAGKAPTIDTSAPKAPKAVPRQQGSSSRGKGGGKPLLDAKKIAKANRGKAGKLIAKKVAGALLKAVPVIGIAAGAWFAATSLAKGDTTTAALEGGSIFLPSLTGVPVDIMAVATSTFFDLYGMPYNQANPEHRILMKEIGEMVAEEFERQKKDSQISKEIAAKEGSEEYRQTVRTAAEAAQRDSMPAAVANNRLMFGDPKYGNTGATGRMLESNASFFESVNEGQYAKGSRANIAMHEAAAAAAAAGGGNTVVNQGGTTVIKQGDVITHKNEQVNNVFGSGAHPGERSDAYGLPGAVQP